MFVGTMDKGQWTIEKFFAALPQSLKMASLQRAELLFVLCTLSFVHPTKLSFVDLSEVPTWQQKVVW